MKLDIRNPGAGPQPRPVHPGPRPVLPASAEQGGPRGIQCWLLGASLMALGFAFMPLLRFKGLLALAMIANPLVVLGHIFLYLESSRSSGRGKAVALGLRVRLVYRFLLFLYIFRESDHRPYRGGIRGGGHGFAFDCHRLLLKKGKPRRRFRPVYGHGLSSLWSPVRPSNLPDDDPAADPDLCGCASPSFPRLYHSHHHQHPMDFGFILMINQRLHAEMLGEKENLQRVFNTGPTRR